MFLLNRPQTQIGKTEYIPNSINEKSIYVIAIVTEGSVEELKYIKGFARDIEKSPKLNIIYLNDLINDNIKSKLQHASHPKQRLKLMKEVLSMKNPDFEKRPNEAWMICDRDTKSFKEEEYDDICKQCSSTGINLVISNPAFQLWLLFHFDSWLREYLYEDNLSSKEVISIIEHRLRQKLKGYQHGNINFAKYGNRVQRAIINSRNYCTDIFKLKYEFGTNMADLIDILSSYKTTSIN